jgi:cyclic pyranopterin phosphate synthase
MIDPFGRKISYVRVSVTDRCDLRCIYCMSDQMTFLPKPEILSFEELDRICSTFIRLGTTKIRITGGEPLVRADVIELFQSLGRHLRSGALHELTLTTNGTQLETHAEALHAAGVRRVNVSLDTLDADKFRTITRRGDLTKVMNGIRAAKATHLEVKINCVALLGLNDDEHDELVAWCGEQGFDLTFIEVMPVGDVGAIERADQYMPLSLVRSRLKQRWTLRDLDYTTGGPARYVQVMETHRRVGFITPLTHNFCENCNRVRLTSTGTLFMCLGQEDAADLRTPVRESNDDIALEAAIRDAIFRKPRGHDFRISRGHPSPSVSRHMSVTGG